jgi:predicted amidohydrolase YtcJ
LALFLGDPLSPGHGSRTVSVGADADLCLLDRPWRQARVSLDKVAVAATIKGGKPVWQSSVD